MPHLGSAIRSLVQLVFEGQQLVLYWCGQRKARGTAAVEWSAVFTAMGVFGETGSTPTDGKTRGRHNRTLGGRATEVVSRNCKTDVWETVLFYTM